MGLTSEEVTTMARLQVMHETDQHYSGYRLSTFLTCMVRPNPEAGGEPEPTVFMVSDQATSMVRDGLLGQSQDPKRCTLREKMEHEILPIVLESGKNTTSFDPDWFVVRVNSGAPKRPRSLFTHSEFPVENRETRPQPRSDLKQYFRSRPS